MIMILTFWRVVVRHNPVSVQGDTNHTAVALELFPIHLDDIGVSNHDIMSHDPWLGSTRVTSGTGQLCPEQETQMTYGAKLPVL